MSNRALEDAAVLRRPVSQRRRILSFLGRRRLGAVGLVGLMALGLLAAGGSAVIPYSPYELGDATLQGPTAGHPFGTDNIGRDLLSRCLVGVRISITVGLSAAFLSLVLGSLIGVVSGYAGGLVDAVTMRLTDVVIAFPGLLLIIAIVALVGRGVPQVTGAIAFLFIPAMVRLARAGVLAERERDYVEAAVGTGASARRVLFRHIVPNVTAPLALQAALSVGFAVTSEASLSFLGLGIAPPTPSLGNIIADGRNYVADVPGFVLFAASLLALLVFSLQAAADVVGAWLDPHQRQT